MIPLRKATYPLLCSLILAGPSLAIEPVTEQPIPTLVAYLKAHGQKRIAQGKQIVITEDSESGKLFNAKSPLMLTENPETGDWTISVFHDKTLSSTLLLGSSLRTTSKSGQADLSSFDRRKAHVIIPKIGKYRPTYYPEEIKRLREEHGFERWYTGKVTQMTMKGLTRLADHGFYFDLLVDTEHSDFRIVLYDDLGLCLSVISGYDFEANE